MHLSDCITHVHINFYDTLVTVIVHNHQHVHISLYDTLVTVIVHTCVHIRMYCTVRMYVGN